MVYPDKSRHKIRIYALFLIAALFLFQPLKARASPQAALFLSPAAGSFLVGSTFDLSIVLNTRGVAINTIEVDLLFPADKLQLASPSVGRSVIQVWPAPPAFSNREGKIYFAGGIPSPGIVTSDGVVLTFTFRVIAPGEAEIKFGDRLSVLANDGKGTNILGQHPSAFFKFMVPPPQGPAISSPTHPDQERWYKDPNPVFVWPRGQFSDGFSYFIDHDPSGYPDTNLKGTAPTVSFSNLDNGIWYFHLRERSGGVWGGVSHFIVKIDNEPPASFVINVSPSLRTANQNPIFRFFTTDALSGFDHFEIKIVSLSGDNVSDVLFFEASSPYQANLRPGRYQIIVRALDRAGTTRDEAAALTVTGAFTQFISEDGIDFMFFFIPWSVLADTLGILFLLFFIILAGLWKAHRHHLKHAFREDIISMFRFLKKTKGLPIAFILFFVFALVLVPTARADALVPKAPTISVAPVSYYPLDEILYIEGNSIPRAKISLHFEKIGANPIRIETESNSNGEWFYSGHLELSSGEWMLRARMESDPPSDWSNPRIIESHITGIVFGSIKVRYFPAVLTFLILILASIFLLIYSLIRLRKIERAAEDRQIQEKTRALEEALHKKDQALAANIIEQNFSEIRKNILEELLHIEESAKNGVKLSPEEEAHHNRLVSKLREAEDIIEKKIKEL